MTCQDNDSDLNNIEDEETADSVTVRPCMYELIRRECDNTENEDVNNSSSFDEHEFQIV